MATTEGQALRPVFENAAEDSGSAEGPGTESQEKAVAPDLSDFSELVRLGRSGSEEEIKDGVRNHLDRLADRHGLSHYHVLYLFDPEASISSYHSNELYEAAASADRKKDILLVVQSSGGKIEPAYLISKTCKRLSLKKFVVAVPRRAKSAATLLALGADEIHMGLMSELGPIDPQIGGYPALGLTNALNKVAELSAKFPRSSDMWSKYLGNKLDLNDLGYFDRVTESAAQYAERLIRGKTLPSTQSPGALANHFVNHYKDHGFVIDSDECITLLGPEIVKTDTSEYLFSNEVYRFLNLVEIVLSAFHKKLFAIIGESSGMSIRSKDQD
ncbi:SDH family Clp fold serine proteinase [Uliginosibacterium sp. H1]|uniref:SDH family Clp fold serine proteinase n=1 Tax=Uliginosibacterium sp. H1 TaxID=3114757 RepID=UPI002E1824CA|nr:hypothetical protein [Uliginosibacterium sp. H1]